jgi:hypothetical protein
MIAPHNQAAANSKQKIDFFTCPHTERLRTAHANRAVCAKSVDSKDQLTTAVDSQRRKCITSPRLSLKNRPIVLNRDAFSADYRPAPYSGRVTGARLATSGEPSGIVANPATSRSGWVSTTPATTEESSGTLTTTYEGAGEFSRLVAVLLAASTTSAVRSVTPS